MLWREQLTLRDSCTNSILSSWITRPAPQPPDLTLQLPRDIYYQIVHTLRGALPPPVTASAEDLAHRDNAAIGEVACLLPANAEEVEIAAQFVAANAQAMVCLRLAQEHRGNLTNFLKCEAQADRMQRQARGLRTLLLSVRAERQKRETDSTATHRAAWTCWRTPWAAPRLQRWRSRHRSGSNAGSGASGRTPGRYCG